MTLLTKDSLLEKLYCIACGNREMHYESDEKIRCRKCGHIYTQFHGVWNAVHCTDNSQKNIQEFWGDLYQQLYQDGDAKLDSTRLYYLLDELTLLLKNADQPIGKEIDLGQLQGQDVLEVGCGAGAHSALMKRAGANIISVDITPERVLSTQEKLQMIKEGSGLALAANAERLPFRDESFDLVYSFGVLHHTTHPEIAVREVYRILKPEGRAVIMLYSKRSLEYLKLYLKGILTGARWKSRNWLGQITEGKPKYRSQENPFTCCYNPVELRQLFSVFGQLQIRKNGFSINQIPKLGRWIEKWLVWRGICRESDGGLLVWDRPLRHPHHWEVRLGKLIGFGYEISCLK